MVPVLFLSPTEWNQIEAAEKEELSVYKELSLGWGEKQTKIWWNEFSDAKVPIVPRASWTPPHLGVQVFTLWNVAKPHLSLCWMFCFIISFLFMIPSHLLRQKLTLHSLKHTPYVKTDLQITSEIAAFVYLWTDVITENNFH